MNNFKHIEGYRDEINTGTAIAVIWTAEDVFGVADEMMEGVELSEEDAIEILRRISQYHDANIGVNWEVIQHHVEQYVADSHVK